MRDVHAPLAESTSKCPTSSESQCADSTTRQVIYPHACCTLHQECSSRIRFAPICSYLETIAKLFPDQESKINMQWCPSCHMRYFLFLLIKVTPQMWHGWSVNTANMIYVAFNLSVLTWPTHIGILMYIKSLVALTLSKNVAFKAPKCSVYVHGSRYLHAKWAEIHCLHNFTHSRTSFNSPILLSILFIFKMPAS